jgi:uncharacterized protein (TIRG00374 family)
VLLWITLAKVSGPAWLRKSALWLLALNVLLMAAMLVIERYKDTVSGWVIRASRRLRPEHQATVQRATEGYLEGLAGMTHVRTLVPIALASVAVWGFPGVAVYFCLGALGMKLSLTAIVAVIVLVSMGSMIPSAPAFIGTTQYACIIALGLFGVGKSEAFAFSILYHATQFFPVIAVGFYFLWKAQIRFADISKR